MIEAVNSVVSNASLLRQSAQQANSAAASNSSVPAYLSLQIEVDTTFDTAVLQVRDSDTGDVLRQFPNESTLQSRQRAEAVRDRAEALQAQRDANSGRISVTAIQESRSEVSASQQAPDTQAAAIAQQANAPQPNVGAGGAQVAIAALSTGAQSGQQQAETANVSVTA
jgi:hypothetical protein